MYLYDTQNCCAVMEIGNLGDHATPVQAMKAFCRSARGNPEAFYIFTGVEEVTDEDDEYKKPDRKDYDRSEYGRENYQYDLEDWEDNRVKVGYGSAFAAYIVKNRLGTVVESVQAPNRVHHKDHICQVWVWAPDVKRLEAWRKRHKED